MTGLAARLTSIAIRESKMRRKQTYISHKTAVFYNINIRKSRPANQGPLVAENRIVCYSHGDYEFYAFKPAMQLFITSGGKKFRQLREKYN